MGRFQTLIDRRVCIDLSENSVVSGRVPYRRSVERGWISHGDLIHLARIADVPHPLFFAPYDAVRAQIDIKTAKLLQGVGKQTFSLNSRDSVKVSDVELIIKDLTRKQKLLRQNDDSLQESPIVGLLRRSRGTAEDDATELLDALELGPTMIRDARTKTLALDALTRHLEAKQVLVSRSVRGFMPQLIEVEFSGLTVRDRKVPYIFLAGGGHTDDQEPQGRQLFTLTLLAVLVARGIFAPVTYNGSPRIGRPARV